MSVVDKLKLDKYDDILVVNQPEDYHIFENSGVAVAGVHDCIFVFVETMDAFEETVKSVIAADALKDKGYLFVAYPKKGNKKYETFVHRDEIFPRLGIGEDGYLDGDLKFSRMVSMDDVFTVVGIKKEVKRRVSNAASQCVNDYIEFVPQVREWAVDGGVGEFFEQLTPGYQKDWARYIYSAKQDKTRLKRIDEMVEILKAGYKSKDLFRQGKK